MRRLFSPRFCEKSRTQKPFVTLLLLFGKISGFAVHVRDSYIRTKDSRRTTMKLTDFYAYTEQTFDSFCKQVIRNERTETTTDEPFPRMETRQMIMVLSPK